VAIRTLPCIVRKPNDFVFSFQDQFDLLYFLYFVINILFIYFYFDSHGSQMNTSLKIYRQKAKCFSISLHCTTIDVLIDSHVCFFSLFWLCLLLFFLNQFLEWNFNTIRIFVVCLHCLLRLLPQYSYFFYILFSICSEPELISTDIFVCLKNWKINFLSFLNEKISFIVSVNFP
jgi:hypothetical protein